MIKDAEIKKKILINKLAEPTDHNVQEFEYFNDFEVLFFDVRVAKIFIVKYNTTLACSYRDLCRLENKIGVSKCYIRKKVLSQ